MDEARKERAETLKLKAEDKIKHADDIERKAQLDLAAAKKLKEVGLKELTAATQEINAAMK